MCFSATASFAASGVLAAASVAIARTTKPKAARPLALFPAFFAVLQFAEGFLWLHHRSFVGDGFKTPALYAFLFIAYALWPMFVPFAAWRLERRRARKVIMLACQVLGLVAGLTNLVMIVRGPVDAWVAGHSFAYDIGMPVWLAAPYVIAVTVPFLAAGNRRLVLFGLGLAAVYGATALVATSATFPSVWCFLAALLSLFLYLFFRYEARRGGSGP